MTFPHTGSSLTLAFGPTGGGWQAGDDESIGIDNLTVTTDAIPEPSTWALAGSALVAIAAIRRRK